MDTTTQDKIRKWTLDLGKVDYTGHGRKSNRVTLEVELRKKINDVAPYLDIDLNPCKEYTELSICGNVWNASGSDITTGGQCVDTIRELFPTGPVARLVELWQRWHLGGMKTGTRIQESFLRDNPVTDRLNYYTTACTALEKANLLHVTGPGTRDYKYGSAWLVEALPIEIEAEVIRLCEGMTANRTATAPECDPQNFAQEHGIKADTERADSNPNMASEDDRGQHHWRVTLRRGKARLVVPFSQGSAHTKPPTAIEVLGCLASDASTVDSASDFADWAMNYGYDVDSRKAEKTFKACAKQAAALKKFLGDDLYKELLDGSN